MEEKNEARELLSAFREINLLHRKGILFHDGLSSLDLTICRILIDWENEQHASPITATELAKRANIAASSLTRVLNKLEKSQYTMRTPSKDNRRIIHITITEKGKEEYLNSNESLMSFMENVIQKMGEEDIHTLINLLHKLSSYSHDEYSEKVTTKEEE